LAILESLIVAGCVGLSGQQNDACQKALTAGSKQSGLEQTTGSYENHESNLWLSRANDWFGKDAVGIMGGAGWLAKSAIERKASFGLPSFGICNSVKFEFNQSAEKLIFQWRF
jgi:hypothetical protein